MKHICTFVFVLQAFLLSAQTNVYHPFPDSNAVWRETISGNGSSSYFTTELEKYIHGDTVIAGRNYHKIFETGCYSEYSIPNFSLVQSYYFYDVLAGFIREDSTHNVYAYEQSFTMDELLYDFNLQLGDTLPFSYNHSNGLTLTVTGIDSMYDGSSYRKRMNISCPDLGYTDYVALIEGIGSTFGLFTPLEPPFEYAGMLHCFMQNDSVRFTDNSFRACEWVSGIGENEESRSAVTVCPNPVSRYAVFRTSDEFLNAELKIFSATGMPVLSRILESSSTPVSFDAVPAGLYFFSVTSEHGRQRTGKIVVRK